MDQEVEQRNRVLIDNFVETHKTTGERFPAYLTIIPWTTEDEQKTSQENFNIGQFFKNAGNFMTRVVDEPDLKMYASFAWPQAVKAVREFDKNFPQADSYLGFGGMYQNTKYDLKTRDELKAG